jgi:hypothetical protein
MGCASTGGGNLDKFTKFSVMDDYFEKRSWIDHGRRLILTINSDDLKKLELSRDGEGIYINSTRLSIKKILENTQYSQLGPRLKNSEVCNFYIHYQFLHLSPMWVVVSIDGLIAFDEIAIVEAQKQAAKEAEAYRTVNSTYNSIWTAFTLLDWDKAFKTREEAEAWLDDIVEKTRNVDDVVRGRRAVYDQKAEELKFYQLREVRDALLIAKNNLIEAYNRYVPINNEITKVLAMGVEFRGHDYPRLVVNYPGLKEEDVKKGIDAYNNDYAKLIDIYPVN